MWKRTVLPLLFLVLLVMPALPDDPPKAEQPEFVFARLAYPGYRGASWATDAPESDYKFAYGVRRLSRIQIEEDYQSFGVKGMHAIRIMDPELFRLPFIYTVEVGYMDIDQEEADRLREYLMRGGFWVVDDFWGTAEFRNFQEQIRKVFPDRPLEQLPMTHPVFHTFFDVDKIIQVPNVGNACRGGPTYERDGFMPYVFGISDDKGRLMVIVNWNTDLGDAWEWMDEPCYPEYYSGFAYRMGLNFIVYAMSH